MSGICELSKPIELRQGRLRISPLTSLSATSIMLLTGRTPLYIHESPCAASGHALFRSKDHRRYSCRPTGGAGVYRAWSAQHFTLAFWPWLLPVREAGNSPHGSLLLTRIAHTKRDRGLNRRHATGPARSGQLCGLPLLGLATALRTSSATFFVAHAGFRLACRGTSFCRRMQHPAGDDSRPTGVRTHEFLLSSCRR